MKHFPNLNGVKGEKKERDLEGICLRPKKVDKLG